MTSGEAGQRKWATERLGLLGDRFEEDDRGRIRVLLWYRPEVELAGSAPARGISVFHAVDRSRGQPRDPQDR